MQKGKKILKINDFLYQTYLFLEITVYQTLLVAQYSLCSLPSHSEFNNL